MAPGISRSRLVPSTGIPNDHRPIKSRILGDLSKLFHRVGPWLCFLMATFLAHFLGFSYSWSLDGYPVKRKSIPQLLGLISCKDPACNHYQTFDAKGETIQCLFLPHHHTTPPLLRLSAEIRNSIYRILLTRHDSINFAMRLRCHLILNKQIYAEARVILYAENDFSILDPLWSVKGGIMKILDRFKKEDVQLIRSWTFQAQIRHTINPINISPSSLTPEQRAYVEKANRDSKAVINDMLEFTRFLREQRPQGFRLSFWYQLDYCASWDDMQDWLRSVHRNIYTPMLKLPFKYGLFTPACDNIRKWLGPVYMACDREWEVHVIPDGQNETTRKASREVTKDFRRFVRGNGLLRNMITQIRNCSTDGTLVSYVLFAKVCQGCERRYVQGEAHGDYPLAAESKYKISHCTCGLTEADITWALTNDIFVDTKGKT